MIRHLIGIETSGNTTSIDNQLLKRSYWLTRALFLRCLGFLYIVAFLISFNQNIRLIGETGLTPAKKFIDNNFSNYYEIFDPETDNTFKFLKRNSINISKDFLIKYELFNSHPTLFWFIPPSNDNLNLFALSGMTLSFLIVILGSANMPILFFLWINYFSIVNVGQTWFSFGWESQLLEIGFLSIFMVPIIY